MPNGEIIIKLGDVFLPYCTFRFPKYRGTVAREVELDCPAVMFDVLANLAKSQPTGGHPMTFTGPATGGNQPSDVTATLGNVWIDRVVRFDQTCRLILFDTRFLLGRRVADVDFRVVFGDDYLNETNYSTTQAALTKLRDSISFLATLTSSDWAKDAPNVSVRDNTYLSGQSLPLALGSFLDSFNADLTMKNDGRLYVVGREDIAASSKLPGLTDYKWHTAPGWVTRGTYISGKPRVLVVYYNERHCLRMLANDSATEETQVRLGPKELRVKLTQMYADGGEYKTLDDLLSDNDFDSTDLTDALIATCYMSDTFENAPIHDSYGTAQFEAVHKAVQDGWRKLYKVEFVDDAGHVGGWTDWQAGQIASDGSVIPVAVECPWVEFLNVIAPEGSGYHPFVNSVSTVNHDSPAPFTVRFEGSESSGIIRLVQKDLRDGNLAVPGALVGDDGNPTSLRVREVSKIQDGEGDIYSLQDFKLVESESRGKARFEPSFTAAVYMCATRRMPNDETRWHDERINTTLADPDIAFIELPPAHDILCVRDYVKDGTAGHFAMSDGLGPILNQTAVTADATQRALGWELTHCAELEGFGIAEGPKLFADYEVGGPISDISLEVEVTETSATVRTRISAGNLADLTSRGRLATTRLAKREWKERGVA